MPPSSVTAHAPTDPGAIVVMIHALEAADEAIAAAHRRRAMVQQTLARSLAASGPRVVGAYRYVGLVSDGLPGTVVRTRVGEAGEAIAADPLPEVVVGAHASTAVYEDRDDGGIEV